MAYFVTLTYCNLFKQTLLPPPNLSPYFIFQLKPVLKVHIGPQKSAIDDWLNSFPRTSKNCKRNQLWCSISHSLEWQLSLRLLQRWSKAEAGHLGDKTWNYKVSNEQIAISTLLLQACFKKQKIPDELSGVFERQGKWHIWELNLAPFVQGKVGGFSCLGNRLWICASWNSLCFSPERVPSVPDKGFLFGICRQPSFGYILFNSLCWWVLIKPHIPSELV